MNKKIIKVMSLNIGNPSEVRAKAQIEWLKLRKEDIIILTETKNSSGCNLIKNYFLMGENSLFNCSTTSNVVFPTPYENNYGVMCITNYNINKSSSIFSENNQYYARYLNNEIKVFNQNINVIGLYVPSRDQSDEKIERKKTFLQNVIKELSDKNKTLQIITGDLNIVDRRHVPYYSFFKEWEYGFYDKLISLGYIDAYKLCNSNRQEYSWIGRTNNGYRYDYCFISNDLMDKVKACYFLHETRNLKLSDHSAIVLELEIEI